MKLRCLGPLKLEDSDFQRPKALFLLAYLANEGQQEKNYLAELFWLGKSRVLRNLSLTIHRLNEAAPNLVRADGLKVWTEIESDTQAFHAAISSQDFNEVLELYQGPFAEGVQLKDGSTELEEWLYQKREYYAAFVREAMLKLAEAQAQGDNYKEAAMLAADAYHLRYTPEPEETDLERLYLLLQADKHLLAKEVKKEALNYGLELSYSQEKAQDKLKKKITQDTPHNLPESLSSFVGRQQELTELSGYISQKDKRLISLVGLGGIGKTRLALELAKEQLASAQYKDGVYFVALDALADSYSIPFEIAEAMNLSLRRDLEPVESLTRKLEAKDLLVFLDNYEHLLEAATLCPLLLTRCPNLKLVVTSRERLNISGEWVYAVRGLSKGKPAPRAVHSDSMKQLKQQIDPYLLLQENPPTSYSDAIDLFNQRAQRTDLNFELSEANQEAIKSICEFVEGSPLAIELAASWVRLLSPEEIATEISQNLELLSSQARDSKERHQSIEAAFEYSWNQLNDKEQAILRKLSVFEGGFSKEAAKDIANASFAMLASLADKSLIRPSRSSRFDLHPLIKQFLEAKLALVHEEQQVARSNHARLFTNLIAMFSRQELRLAGRTPYQSRQEFFDAIAIDYDNILAAWRWSISTVKDNDFFGVAFGLGGVISFLFRHDEGIKLYQEAESLLSTNPKTHAPSLAVIISWKSWLLMERGLFNEAVYEGKRVLKLLETETEPHVVHFLAFHSMTNYQRKAGPFIEARKHALMALDYAKRLNLKTHETTSRSELSIIYTALGEYEKAEESYEERLQYLRKNKVIYQVGMCLTHLGELYLYTKRYNRARDALSEGLAVFRKVSEPLAISRCLDDLSQLDLEEDNLEVSRLQAEESLALAKSFGGGYYEARALITLGRIETTRHNFDQSFQYLISAIRLAHKGGVYSSQLCAVVFLAELKLKQGQFDDVYTWLSLAEHHNSAEYWVKEKARGLLDSLKASKNSKPGEYTSANLDMDQVIANLL